MEKSLPVKFYMDIFSLLSLLGNLLGKFTEETLFVVATCITSYCLKWKNFVKFSYFTKITFCFI